MHEMQEGENVSVIHQRLAGAHEHHRIHLAILLAEKPLDEEHLREHLARRKVARHAMKGGSAESAAHVAARLRGDADAVAIRLTHEHGLHRRTIRELKQELARLAIGRMEGRLLPRRGNRELFVERSAQLLGEIGHLRKGARPSLIQPRGDLLGTVCRNLQRRKRLCQVLDG